MLLPRRKVHGLRQRHLPPLQQRVCHGRMSGSRLGTSFLLSSPYISPDPLTCSVMARTSARLVPGAASNMGPSASTAARRGRSPSAKPTQPTARLSVWHPTTPADACLAPCSRGRCRPTGPAATPARVRRLLLSTVLSALPTAAKASLSAEVHAPSAARPALLAPRQPSVFSASQASNFRAVSATRSHLRRFPWLSPLLPRLQPWTSTCS